MVVTCPDKKAHTDVVSERLTDALCNDGTNMGFLDSLLGGPIIKAAVNNYFTVDNYVFFSLGRISVEDKGKVISVGFLGHVFAPSKEMIVEAVKDDDGVQSIL